ncbi:GNAT family N-acetyltransferase [Paracoccus yeei]|uniref:GNAT family N-acetyltransferase n=1 Tax=Paracoccus yeei TaxID=147645 RepID=UPI001C8E2D1A|nr:GNAT family N-acyltransferase [Paracoccus yeei]MBY0136636.1 GNAT family N-acetyltransferase [Paracoccus yeei]
MMPEGAYFETRLARREADLLSAQRLRYRVFVEELGADGDLVDHENRLERDAFDPVVDHLVLVDRRRPESDLEHVVGLYRLLPGDRIGGNDRFYCDGEYDLSPLRRSGRRVLELGRSCMAPDFRGGSGMFLLWSALAEYVLDRQVEVLFGVASFHGTDAGLLAQPLSWLYRHHLAPEGMRPRARPEGYQRMDLVPEARLDRRAAMAGMPPLIKAYLRLGGVVGEGAFLDHAFNTTDVFLMVDTAAMSARHRRFYEARGLTE